MQPEPEPEPDPALGLALRTPVIQALSAVNDEDAGLHLTLEAPVPRHLRGLPLVLPPAASLAALTQLTLASAQLIAFPAEAFAGAHQLRVLRLASNALKELPEEGWGRRWPVLEELDVAHNQLRRLPPALGELVACRRLNFRSNQLRSWQQCSAVLARLQSLDSLDLRYNSRLQSLDEATLRDVLPGAVIGGGGDNGSIGKPTVLVGAEAGVPIRRGSALTKIFAGDGPGAGWPTLLAQLAPLSTPAALARLRTVFGEGIEDAELANSRDEIFARLLAAYQRNAPRGAPAGRERREVQRAGPELPLNLRENLLCALRAAEWPAASDRPKVHAVSYLVLERPPLGAPAGTQGAIRSEKKRRRHATLWDAVAAYMQHADPSFYYTGVAISRGFRGSPHIDAQDIAYQWALSLGDFEGGALCIESSPTEVSVVDTHNRPAKVDGRYIHWVSPWAPTVGTDAVGGERYSVITYKTRGEAFAKGCAWYPT